MSSEELTNDINASCSPSSQSEMDALLLGRIKVSAFLCVCVWMCGCLHYVINN